MIKYNLSAEKLTPATPPRPKFVCACVHSWGEEGKSNLWRTCWVSGVCFFGTREGVEGKGDAGCAHPGLQLSNTSRATVNVLDCWSPEINAVISSLSLRETM